MLPHHLGKVRRPNFFKITSDKALKHITDDQNETVYVLQLKQYCYCSVVDKLFTVCSLTCLIVSVLLVSNALSVTLWSVWCQPFSQLCFSSLMLCIRDWKDSLLDDTSYLAKARLRFRLLGSHRFSRKRWYFLKKSYSNLCLECTNTINM